MYKLFYVEMLALKTNPALDASPDVVGVLKPDHSDHITWKVSGGSIVGDARFPVAVVVMKIVVTC